MLWYLMPLSLNVFHRKDVEPAAFTELLTKGKGKFKKILIVEPANCGKTFIYGHQEKKYFFTYAWLGAQKADLVFLNNCCSSQEIVASEEFLFF